MAGEATTKTDAATTEFLIALLPENGGVRRFSKKEDAPDNAMLFASPSDLGKMEIAALDAITMKLLKAQVSTSRSKSEAVERAWTALLASSAAPSQERSGSDRSGNRTTRTSNAKFKLLYDFDQPAEKAKMAFEELPPQAKTCLKIMASGGKDEYSEAELRKLVEENGKDLATRQEPWRIFQYYRRRLADEKFIQAA